MVRRKQNSLRRRPHPPALRPTMSSPAGISTTGPTPRPIPEQKLKRAVELYRIVLEETEREQFEQGLQAHSNNTLLSPISAGPSVFPATGRRRAVSTSFIEDGTRTEFSTGLSAHDDSDLHPNSPASQNGQHGRKRSRFTPLQRARTHLIRHLGACPQDCKNRGVQCNLELHHDVARLQSIIDQEDALVPSLQPGSSTSESSRGRAAFALAQRRPFPAIPRNELLGIGAQLGTLFPETRSMDNNVQGGFVPSINITVDAPDAAPGPDQGSDLYMEYEDGATIILGVGRHDHFACQHLSGCPRVFQDVDSLQVHFAMDHFAYTRLDPPLYYICREAKCRKENGSDYIRCFECNMHGSIETRVHGRLTRSHSHAPGADNGFPPLQYNQVPPTYFPGAYRDNSSDVEIGSFPPGAFDDGSNESPFDNMGTQFERYGSSAPGSYYNDLNSFNSGGSHASGSYQGNYYGHRQQYVLAIDKISRLRMSLHRHGRRLQQILLVLLVIILSSLYLNWSEASFALPKVFAYISLETRKHWPSLGFVATVLGFGISMLAKYILRQASVAYTVHPGFSLRVPEPFILKYQLPRHDGYIPPYECL